MNALDETTAQRVERLIAERADGSSPLLSNEEHAESKAERSRLTAFAEGLILEECVRSGRRVGRDYLERKILTGFMETRGWDSGLEMRFSERLSTGTRQPGNIAWVNAIAHARATLAGVHGGPKLLMMVAEVEGGDFFLAEHAEQQARQRLRERDIQTRHGVAEGVPSPLKTKLRKGAQVIESDSVYIIVDPKRPSRCKIGAGNGTCEDRLREARLWTDGEATVVHIEQIGAGMAIKVEQAVHRELQKQHGGQGEWVQCGFAIAVPVVKAWAERARRPSSIASSEAG